MGNIKDAFIPLDIYDECLDKIVSELRQKILSEFWPDIPDGEYKETIKSRLDKSIIDALNYKHDKH